MQAKNRVLIVGSGGREHAFAWKISQSEKVEKIFVAPGNAGTEEEAKAIKNNAIRYQENWKKYSKI